MDFMCSESVDLVLTSPPYDNLRKYNGYSFPFEQIAKEIYRILKRGGICVWVVGDATVKGSETGTSFRQALHFISLGFKLHDTMIYQKKNFIPQTAKRYEQSFEFMFVFSKGTPTVFNPLMIPCSMAGKSFNHQKKGFPASIEPGTSQRRRDQTTIIKSSKIAPNIFLYAASSGRTGHPAPFPEQLAADHITSWTNPGDTVYDPFTGSGTTWKMCLQHDRKFIGSEISSEYCIIAHERIAPYLCPNK